MDLVATFYFTSISTPGFTDPGMERPSVVELHRSLYGEVPLICLQTAEVFTSPANEQVGATLPANAWMTQLTTMSGGGLPLFAFPP